MYEVQPGSHPSSPQRRSGVSGSKLFGCIFGGVGSIFAILGFAFLWQYWRASDWPTVPGTVMASRVESRRGSKGGTTHLCKVEYRYVVNGQPFVGNKLEPMEVSSSGRGAYEDQQEFPPGGACLVHYNPAKPDESVLRVKAGWFQWLFAGIGMICVAIGVGAFAAGWYKGGGPQG
ncbi:MAG: DUF3592 domain-containing protein [Planctomycetes bacterium]|nr:DUF3592 domain-containing protein [Planctomycetota bacterium]